MTQVTIHRTESLRGEVCAPPSKAYTQRMLISAALSKGDSKLSSPLISDDTEAALKAIRAIGAKVVTSNYCWHITGADPIRGPKEPIDCGESGATLRFMVPVAALASDSSVFVLGSGLAKRPLEPLLQSLQQLGVQAYLMKNMEKTSVFVKGGGLKGGKASLPGDVSSQFISGLMFACPLAQTDTEIELTTPLESRLYVKMTQSVLAQHNVNVAISDNYSQLKICANQTYAARDGIVPGDFSSGAFLLAAAALTNSDVLIKNLDYTSVQGDKAILGILKKMGVEGTVCRESIQIRGADSLSAFDMDARDIPDLVPVCAALACFAKGSSRIRNASRLRLKESDRLMAIFMELKKMGADIAIDESSLTVKGPCELHGAVIDPHNDHRIAMACAVAALRAEGETIIHDAECVRKSYPHFFHDLSKLGVDVLGWELDW